jgi:MFS family permease
MFNILAALNIVSAFGEGVAFDVKLACGLNMKWTHAWLNGKIQTMRLIWQRRWPHYAWVIITSVIVVNFVVAGVRLSFGVFINPLVAMYGWSRGDVSLAYTLQYLIAIPAVLMVGQLGERIGARRMTMVGAVIFVIGMLLTSTVTQLWQFNLYLGVLIGLSSAAFMILLPVLLGRWFYQKLGLAIGLMWLSHSLGPAILSPLFAGAIEAVGWSQTFIIFGLIGGTLILISGFFLRDNPEEKKLAPYGGLSFESRPDDISPPVVNIKMHQVVRMKSFWALTAIHALGCVGHSVLLAHVVSIATLAGIPSVSAASILSFALMSSVISRFGMSLLAEAKGGRFTLALAILLQTLPMLLLLYARELWLFYSFALLFGLGYGGEMVGFPIFNRQYYGIKAPLGTIYSYQLAGALLGMAVGGWLGGALFDWTGAYTWSILVAIGAGFLGTLMVLVLPSHRQ